MKRVLLLTAILYAAGCAQSPAPTTTPTTTEPTTSAVPTPTAVPAAGAAHRTVCRPRSDSRPKPPPTFIYQQPARLIAIGDVHGDYQATIEALLLAGVVEVSDDGVVHWSGGCDVVVQTGDQLDRGTGEQKILDLFETLADEAWQAGGAFYSLLGNHEIMNVRLNFRYVLSEQAWADFQNISYDEAELLESLGYQNVDDLRRRVGLPNETRYFYVQDEDLLRRTAAFAPGSIYANSLAEHNVVMVVGDTVFVHGGIHRHHADYGLENINSEVQAYMRGDSTDYPDPMMGDVEGVVWSRHFSRQHTSAEVCALLADVLAAVPAQRMVVAHTIQYRGINSECDGEVWRIDTGMSSHYGGEIWVLEIVGDKVTSLN